MKFKVDMDMLTDMLRKLYGQPPVVISVREMLQNAEDACKKAGVKPKIQIRIEWNPDGVWVICTDNGCGMDLDTIENAFLKIGNPHKELEKDAVGRFGVGIKVAVNSQSEWYVRTNEYSFDKAFLLDEERKPDIVSSPIQGTEIGTFCKETMYDSYIDRALEMVYFSNVEVELIYKKNGETLIHEITTPFIPAREDKQAKQYTSYLHPLQKFHEKYKSTGPKNVFRIGGLVQYITEGANGRKTNLIFDFKTTPYPFTPSRGELAGDVRYEVQRLINKHDVDSVSGYRKLVDEPVKKNTKRAGYYLRGKRGFHDEEDEKDAVDEYIERRGVEVTYKSSPHYDMVNGKLVPLPGQTIIVELSDGCEAKLPAELVQRLQLDPQALVRAVLDESGMSERIAPPEPQKPESPALLFKDYEPKSTAQMHKDTSYLKVWMELLQLVADPEEEFGIGLTGEELSEHAERCYYDGAIFYLLNPKFLNQVHGREPQVLALWTLACHEVTHFREDTHNERFTSLEGEIQRLTAEDLWNNLKEMKRLL